MKRLILMRHAKSSWDDPALGDHARPLNGRGRMSAKVLGDWLRIWGYLPDRALVSSAARTRETFARLALPCDTQFLDALYHAGPDGMLALLRQAEGGTVLLIGHNPGIADFARSLPKAPPGHPRFNDYPTCATLVADFDIPAWADLEPGTGSVANFVIPRELTG